MVIRSQHFQALVEFRIREASTLAERTLFYRPERGRDLRAFQSGFLETRRSDVLQSLWEANEL